MQRTLSKTCSSRPSVILACKSCTPLALVVASRFCMFLAITTSSGGKEPRSRGRVVEESGEEGTKSPNDPKAPNSDIVNEGLAMHQPERRTASLYLPRQPCGSCLSTHDTDIIKVFAFELDVT